MKKLSKVLLASLVALMMMFSFAQPVVFAEETKTDAASSASQAMQTLDDLKKKTEETANKGDTSAATEIGAKVINWIWGISIVVAVVVLMIIGLKFIMGSTSEKAEYKKSLIPVVVGVLILVFATTIVRVLFSIPK